MSSTKLLITASRLPHTVAMVEYLMQVGYLTGKEELTGLVKGNNILVFLWGDKDVSIPTHAFDKRKWEAIVVFDDELNEYVQLEEYVNSSRNRTQTRQTWRLG